MGGQSCNGSRSRGERVLLMSRDVGDVLVVLTWREDDGSEREEEEEEATRRPKYGKGITCGATFAARRAARQKTDGAALQDKVTLVSLPTR